MVRLYALLSVNNASRLSSFICRLIWVWTNSFQCQRDVLPSIIISVNSGVSGACSTLIRRRHSYMPSSRCSSTTATQSSPRLRKQPTTGYECWMLPPESSVTPGSSTMDSRDWCTRSYTGWTSLSESVMLTHRCLLGKAPLYLSNCRPSRSRNTSASAVCCTSSADRSETSSQHLRSSGIRCHWSNDVQHCQMICGTPLSAQQSTNNCWKHTICLSGRLAH